MGLEQRRDADTTQTSKEARARARTRAEQSKSKSKSIERRMSSELVEADLEGDVGPVTILAPIQHTSHRGGIWEDDVVGASMNTVP